VTLARDVDDAPQEVQSDMPYGLRDIQRAQPFGLSSVPHQGAESLVLNIGPDQSVAVVVSDTRYEIRGLVAGEVALHDAHGHSVRLTADGIVIVTGGDAVSVQALASAPSGATHSGVVHGTGIDPFTGLTYFALGNTTAQLKTEKT
jgi:phage gp45-like